MTNGVQEVIENLGKLALVRENPALLVIVHSGTGMEILSNTTDLVMKLGMLDVAKMTIVDVHARQQEEHAEEVRRSAVKASAVFSDHGKAN